MRALCILTVLTACGHAGEDGPEAPPSWSPLPEIRSGPDGEPRPIPSLCEWAKAPDEVVWGSIAAVRVLATPAVRTWTVPGPDGQHQWAWAFSDECTYVNHAMSIDLAVERSLAGTSGVVTISIGAEQRAFFHPSPILGDDGDVTWDPKTVPEPLQVGQHIGAPLHRAEAHGVWSLMGDLLFALDGPDEATDHVVFQIDRIPEAQGLTLEPFWSRMAACEPNEASETRRGILRRWWGPDHGRPPSYYFAATCIVVQPDVTCESTNDCPEGFRCYEGTCR